MKARGGRFLLVVGAGLAVMAFVVVYLLMSKSTLVASQTAAQAVPTPPPTRSIVVANANIPAYTMLDASNTTVTDVDSSSVETSTTSDPSVVVGQMSTVAITKGAQIQTSVLSQQGFSASLKMGEKAFALAVPPRDTFGGSIASGDHVDVLWSIVIENKPCTCVNGASPTPAAAPTVSAFDMVTSTKTLLQNIRVVRVINLQSTLPPKQAGTDAAQTNATPVSVVVAPGSIETSSMYYNDADYQQVLILAVTDQQAEVLKYLHENGNVDLVLRSSAVQKDAKGNNVLDAANQPVVGDNGAETTTGITLDMLIKQYGLLDTALAAPTPTK